MEIIKKENRIYFNDNDISFGNISIHDTYIKIEMIRIIPEYRGQGLGHKLFIFIINYIRKNFNCKKIILSPLPIKTGGDENILNLEQLVIFYKKFGFKMSEETTKEEPYLMVLKL